MSKLKEDWQVATRGEKVKFITLVLFELLVGGYAIYLALLFAFGFFSKNADYTLLIPIALLLTIAWLITKVPTRPKKAR